MGAPEDLVALGPWQVAASAALILVQGVVSAHLRLGLHGQLLVAALRCVLQLSLLGYILVPIFSNGHWYVVLGYALFMVTVSALEAVGRPVRSFKGMFPAVLMIVLGSATLVMAYALALVMRVHPFYSAQYLIPVLGMVLGNTISAISVGLSGALEGLASHPESVERLLALGATRVEATHALVKRCLGMAMMPLLNQMSVVGLVSIPGMMTGQILAGADPSQAARYQIAIMFLLGATSTLGAVAAVYTAVLSTVDACHRVRLDRLAPKQQGTGINALLSSLVVDVAGAVAAAGRAVGRAVRRCCGGDARREAEPLDPAQQASSQREPLLGVHE